MKTIDVFKATQFVVTVTAKITKFVGMISALTHAQWFPVPSATNAIMENVLLHTEMRNATETTTAMTDTVARETNV